MTDAAQFGPEWSAGFRRGTDAELRGWVDAALGWCNEADIIALEHFRARPHTIRKPDGSFVTAADTAIEALVLERLTSAFPGHGAFGEELGDRYGTSGVAWHIDPIDGTHNYLRGVPIFATLLGVARDGVLQAGVISAPALGRRWYAWRGGGAWAVDRAGAPKRIEVSQIAELGEASLSSSSTSELEASGRAPGFRDLARTVWRERAYGDFWSYALLAEGAIDIMIETALSPWDWAAPTVLVEEAGGRITDFDGRRTFDGSTIVATNGHLHDAVRAALAGREETTG